MGVDGNEEARDTSVARTVHSPRQSITHHREQQTKHIVTTAHRLVLQCIQQFNGIILWINDIASARARTVRRTSGLVARWDPIIMYWCAANYAIGVCGLASFDGSLERQAAEHSVSDGEQAR